MELRHLRFFVAVAETLNFTRAAERLNTAQPSLSQQIRQLEREIGRSLFERSSRSVRLTEAGKVFLTEARQVLAQLEQAIQASRAAPTGPDGRLVVGFLNAAEASLFPRLLGRMREEIPSMDVELRNLSSRQQVTALLKREIDIGFLRPPIDDKRIAEKVALRERIWLVVAEDHPLARHAKITPAMLDNQPHVGVTDDVPGLLHAVRQWTVRTGVRLRTQQAVANVLAYMSMVRLGVGIGLLPDFATTMLLPGLVHRPIIEDTPTINLVMAWRADSQAEKISRFVAAASHILDLSDQGDGADAGGSGGVCR